MQSVHLTCSRERLHDLVESFTVQFARSSQVSMLDYGHSGKHIHGYIVLDWSEDVDEAFLEQLDSDSDVLDYSTYTSDEGDEHDNAPPLLITGLLRGPFAPYGKGGA